jgi:hypothetical protein
VLSFATMDWLFEKVFKRSLISSLDIVLIIIK